MDFKGINNSIKKVIDFNAEKELYRFLKEQIPHIILGYNKEQLFVDSVDANGISLGFYRGVTNPKYNKQYDMDDTGLWKREMQITIKYRKIEVFSNKERTDQLLDSSNYHDGVEFFGLTNKNFKKLQSKWIVPFLTKKLKPNFTR